jgi:hypothetical protein
MTTTEVARLDSTALPGFGEPSDALERLSAWVDAASNAAKLVAPLVSTAFIPDAYRPKVDPRASDEDKDAARQVAIANGTAAVLLGITLGLDPMTALQQIYIVKGRPGLYARIKVALLIARGHEVWTDELSDTSATVCGRRLGSDHIERVTITIEQAKTAGWTTNDTYTKTPADMLYARAAGRVCDRIAPDVLMGIASIEEVPEQPTRVTAEVGPSNGRRVTAAEILAATRPAEPAPAGPSTAEPDSPPADPPAVSAESRMSDRQKRQLFALLKSRGYADKDAALALIAVVIGREIVSRNEMTAAETDQVIAKLDAMPVLNPDKETPS